MILLRKYEVFESALAMISSFRGRLHWTIKRDYFLQSNFVIITHVTLHHIAKTVTSWKFLIFLEKSYKYYIWRNVNGEIYEPLDGAK
jgi:hypothetical protein